MGSTSYLGLHGEGGQVRGVKYVTPLGLSKATKGEVREPLLDAEKQEVTPGSAAPSLRPLKCHMDTFENGEGLVALPERKQLTRSQPAKPLLLPTQSSRGLC